MKIDFSKINWKQLGIDALKLVAPAVKLAEIVAADVETGASKKSFAQDVIAGATGLADAELSAADQQKADAISQLVSTSIDSTVSTLRSSGQMPQKIGTVVTDLVASSAVGLGIGSGAIPLAPEAPAATE